MQSSVHWLESACLGCKLTLKCFLGLQSGLYAQQSWTKGARAACSQNSWLQRPTSMDDPDLSSMSAVWLYTGHSGQRALPEPCKTSSSRPLDSAAVEYIWSEIVRLHAVLKVTCDCVCKRKLSAANAAGCQQFFQSILYSQANTC